ncbi:MAG: type IV secretory system conjugative DNA transfer family protein, partial [Rhizobiaceae bacterium]
MARVFAYRIAIAILVLLAFWLLWSLAYEIVVALRFAPHRFAGEGADRWALLKAQNANRSADFFLIAWKHFYARLVYPPTRAEALIRACYAGAAVVALGIAGAIFG